MTALGCGNLTRRRDLNLGRRHPYQDYRDDEIVTDGPCPRRRSEFLLSESASESES